MGFPPRATDRKLMPRADDAVRLIRSRATVTDFIGEWGLLQVAVVPPLLVLACHCLGLVEEEKLFFFGLGSYYH